MNESNSIEPIDRRNLTKQTKIRLDKITETESYFHQEISQRKLCSKKLSKYVAAFDYIDKILIVLGATSGGVSIISQQTFVGLQDVLKTSSRHVLKTSSTRLQRNNFTPSKTS